MTAQKKKSVGAEQMKVRVFLSIPYKKPYQRYEVAIRAALRVSGLEPVIARESTRTVTILEEVSALIDSCQYAIVDISGWNFNVALEMGYVVARDLPYVILKNSRTKAPADLQGLKYQEYGNVQILRSKLVRWIHQNIPEAKDLPEAIEARKLVQRIMKDAELTPHEAEEVLLAALQPRSK